MKTKRGRYYLCFPGETIEEALEIHKTSQGKTYLLGFRNVTEVLKYVIDIEYLGSFKIIDWQLKTVWEGIEHEQ